MAAVPITVPSVGESISEGIVARWLKADGSPVQAGEPLLELETDKATNVVPAPGSGVLKIGVAEGETVADRRDGRYDRAGRRRRRRGTAEAGRERAAGRSDDRRAAEWPGGAIRRSGARARRRRRGRSAAVAVGPADRGRAERRRLPDRRHRAGRPDHQGGRDRARLTRRHLPRRRPPPRPPRPPFRLGRPRRGRRATRLRRPTRRPLHLPRPRVPARPASA